MGIEKEQCLLYFVGESQEQRKSSRTQRWLERRRSLGSCRCQVTRGLSREAESNVRFQLLVVPRFGVKARALPELVSRVS